MKNIARSTRALPLAIAVAAFCLPSSLVHGAVVINIKQEGTSVVATFSGSLSGLGSPDSTAIQPYFNGFQGNNQEALFFSSNPGTAATMNFWSGSLDSSTNSYPYAWGASTTNLHLISPSSYAATGFTAFTMRVAETSGSLYLDQSYVFGTEMNATWQFDNKTLAEMDLVNLGTYVYKFGGLSGDTVTVNIGAVPEPSVTLLGALGSAFLFRRRRNS